MQFGSAGKEYWAGIDIKGTQKTRIQHS